MIEGVGEVTSEEPTGSRPTWEEIGKSAAEEIGIPPRQVLHIEARGFLCHELVYLVGGNVEFVHTPWKNITLKTLELLFPIAPIFRWNPPSKAELECVGYHAAQETMVYRLRASGTDPVIFFVNFKPDPPASGRYIRSLFKVPQLDFHRFLRPPFGKNNDTTRYERVFRGGMVERFEPIPMTDGARDALRDTRFEVSRGLWQEFSNK